MWIRRFPLVLFVVALAVPCGAGEEGTPVCGVTVVNSYPHDPGAFTQGLFFADGFLYEGTGRHGQSSLRRIDLETGAVVQEQELAEEFFGEGIALHGERIIQLTWLSGTGFIYDRSTFELLGTFEYEHEGWGVTGDGRRLVVSDGSANLRVWDPESFEEVGRLQVHDEQGSVEGLNELEFVRGELLANVYPGDRIARIDTVSGKVITWIDVPGLLGPRLDGAGVLNGIASDEIGGRLFVTGKNWPRLYEIEIIGCGERPFPTGP
jgi:glutamine cyclotransferase